MGKHREGETQCGLWKSLHKGFNEFRITRNCIKAGVRTGDKTCLYFYDPDVQPNEYASEISDCPRMIKARSLPSIDARIRDKSS